MVFIVPGLAGSRRACGSLALVHILEPGSGYGIYSTSPPSPGTVGLLQKTACPRTKGCSLSKESAPLTALTKGSLKNPPVSESEPGPSLRGEGWEGTFRDANSSSLLQGRRLAQRGFWWVALPHPLGTRGGRLRKRRDSQCSETEHTESWDTDGFPPLGAKTL